LSFVIHEARFSGIAGFVGAGNLSCSCDNSAIQRVPEDLSLEGRAWPVTARRDRFTLTGLDPRNHAKNGSSGWTLSERNISLSRLDLVSRFGWISEFSERRKVND